MDFTITFLNLFLWSMYLLSPLLLFLAGIIVILGQLVTTFEKWNRFDGLYWSFITATTVGYGDIRPIKKLSKALSVIIALTGMIFTGIMIGASLNTVTVTIQKHIDPAVIEQIKQDIDA